MEQALIISEKWNEVEIICPNARKRDVTRCRDSRILIRFQDMGGMNHHLTNCPFCGEECESKEIC